MFLKSAVLAIALSLSSVSAYANFDNLSCVDYTLSSQKEIQKRIQRLNIEMKTREDIIKIRKELAEDAIKTSGKSKVAWTVGALPATLVGMTTPLNYQIFYQGTFNAIRTGALGPETLKELATFTAYSAASVAPVIYGNYKLGFKGLMQSIHPDLDARSLITLPDHAEEKLKNNENIEIINHSVSPICYLSYLRLELDQAEKSVFENELDGSIKNTIKDHILAGTVAANGATKLYEITYLRQLIDIAELKMLKSL